MKDVIVVVGAGSIGQAIARRVGAGKHVLLASLHEQDAAVAAQTFCNAGFDVSVAGVDVTSRDSVQALVKTASKLGNITGLIHAAGLSPSQASPASILRVDLYGTALVLALFGEVIARGGSGVVIASQSGHRLPALTQAQDKALATTPVEDLLQLDWLRRGARLNTISPGIIITPLAKDELTGPRGASYRQMIEGCPVGRAGTPDEVGQVAALLMGPDGAFITGSDFLMDGGVTAAYRFGDLAPPAAPA